MSGQIMMFPDSVEEFMESYKMVDTEHIYSNGTEYVPIFRMKQWFEHEVKHGRWIDYKCSVCGFEPYNPSGMEKFNYCSNCGADMRGDEDEIQGKK